MILKNTTVYTMDEALPQATAVAVQGDKIVYVGDEAGLASWMGAETEVLDLAGKTVVPGMIESHAHFLGIGRNRMEIDLMGTTSYQQIIDKVAEAVAQAEPGEWITGRGWHQSKWTGEIEMVKGFPTHHALSAVSPENPVFFRHASGHAGLANAKAMELAGVSSETTFDETGEVIKGPDGEPTGIFNEESMQLIDRVRPSQGDSQEEAMQLAIEECLAKGLTSVHDAGMGPSGLATYQAFLDQGKLDIRLYVMLDGKNKEQLNNWFERGPQLDDWLTVRSIKCYADGALGSRGALLLEPYTDQPETIGNPDMTMEDLAQVCKGALTHGFQVGTHAIGDRANREVLDTYEAAFDANPGRAKDHRFRVEHAQHLHPDDIPRFGELNVIASMQGIHMASDRPWAIDRLGKLRIEMGAYMWARLLETGARVINGTDAPVEPVDPIACFYASVTRQTLAGTPQGGYEPDQRMTREQALRSYTLDAAYGAFQEDRIGSIEVGKLADFTVLSQDIMTIPDNQILQTEVDYTIVGGKVRYKR
jgi:predicted amidohydrolase YtcJ